MPSHEQQTQADRLARLALNHAVEPADQHLGRLLEAHGPRRVLAAIRAGQLPDLDADPARRDRLADRCAGLRLRLEPGRVEAGLAAAEAVGARFVTPLDRDWPARLDDLGPQRPIGLWVAGNWCAETTARGDDAAHPQPLSIVGARACSGYGSHVAGLLGADLASAGACVVSGAAIGIDAAAHRGALAVGGSTIAVLACGIDRVYPRVHESLLRAIAQRGAVLSELPPGAAPTRFRFLHRNRLIAALGVGTVVVEAARRSGSLLTARLAGELGRAVMAVPGPVTSEQSVGAHELIRDGAILVATAAQVQEACANLADAPPTPARPSRARAADTSDEPPAVGRARTRARPGRAASAEPADPVEELVLEALFGAQTGTAKTSAGADVVALARATGLGPDAVFAALGRLAACGRVAKSGGGWVSVRGH
ncbi:DNA-processing protein DprA [Actinocrinis puniceicyclus]|uniref:DNA-processing protein DprA n=1 Tax=Actinocrinis puniceicyclus TaxID=977794 RepID=A0A8J8BDH8_9ACTN|nr:DNA-processing protein DprA [Actinocrinis puniceicyclus]MBS2962829.1 DNA-processing protein DprA [Actinocrinis puniceicyclus]